jgi:hypothetical protein
MSTELDVTLGDGPEPGVTLTAAAVHCQRCGGSPLGFQLTSSTGYVQLCGGCLGVVVDLARRYLASRGR